MSLGIFMAIILVSISFTKIAFGSEFEVPARFDQMKGYRLVDSVIEDLPARVAAECIIKCSENQLCRSLSYQDGTQCYLSNKNRRSAQADDFKSEPGFTYYEKDPCVPNPCLFGGTCSKDNSNTGFLCSCKSGYKGSICQAEHEKSCKDIKSSGRGSSNGVYTIDPEVSGRDAMKVYCDMSQDGGGWLLVSNIVLPNPASVPTLTVRTSYRDIANYNDNKTVISATALGQLRQRLGFTQIRFNCRIASVGRTVNVITAANSTGYAVVDFFSAATGTRPHSCDSFYRGTGDNSLIAGQCNLWDNGAGKWSMDGVNELWRLHNHAMYVHGKHHWVTKDFRFECDAFTEPWNPGDYWKIYVR